ncbi:MAG: putative bifunctional diguanylate cyclase/phosphodiesterase [Rhizobiaceae bacterium]
MRVIDCIATLHDPWLVLLAAIVCVGGGWVAFELFRRARIRAGKQRTGWLMLAAIAAGASVWCTHFIAMLAYDASAPVTYDPVLTMLSLLSVIAGAALGFALGLSPRYSRALAGGVVIGLAISVMHYSGMAAFHVDGIIEWDAAYILASVLMAALCGALSVAASHRGNHILALIMFVAGVVGLHFTGMTAISVTPFITGAPLADATVIAGMAAAVAGVALIIVGTGITSHMIDSDASEKNLDTLRQMAMSDALTGLPNRASFNDYIRFDIQQAAAHGHHVAVIGIDLDKFKEINDLRGHEAGDQALRTIATRLTETLREGEFVARIGGDEFAAVKRFTEQRDLTDFVNRVETQLFTNIRIDDFDVTPGASIGIAVFPQDGDTPARLVSNADLAMYRAKTDVTRVVCFYEAEMDERARERRDLALDLRRAIERRQLHLHYQVQTSISEQKRLGYEVLLRWNHPVHGSVPPSDFIPLAEETGTILTIGEWVLREACRQAAAWQNEDKIAVNLSAVQLAHSDLPTLVHEILLETGLAPSRLELEITESSIIHDKVRSLHALRRIRALGVTIAIDDFGTGYSSLETLRSFPFDRIKLDKSFMKEIEHSKQALAIIRAVLALGKSLDISVLAEGVETEEQLALLRQEGCDHAQGYLLGRPAPLPENGAAARAKPGNAAAA